MLLNHNNCLYISREVFTFTQAQIIKACLSTIFVVRSSAAFWPRWRRNEGMQQSLFVAASLLFNNERSKLSASRHLSQKLTHKMHQWRPTGRFSSTNSVKHCMYYKCRTMSVTVEGGDKGDNFGLVWKLCVWTWREWLQQPHNPHDMSVT